MKLKIIGLDQGFPNESINIHLMGSASHRAFKKLVCVIKNAKKAGGWVCTVSTN